MAPSKSSAIGVFPPAIKRKALLSSRRQCCLCEKKCGVKIECHHIVQGGPNTFENCIPLCFDCHSEVKHYNDKHPRGTKYTPSELRARRDQWYARVSAGQTEWSRNRSRQADRKALMPATGQPGPQADADKRILRDFLALLPSDGVMNFLRIYDFGAAFHNDELRPIYRYYYRRNGPDHEFLNPELETARKKFLASCGALIGAVGKHTFVIEHQPRLRAVPSDWRHKSPELFYSASQEINAAADAVCSIYDDLVRRARKKLAV